MDEDYLMDFNSSDYNSTTTDVFFVVYFIGPALVGIINLVGLFGNGVLAWILRKTPASNAPYVCILNLAIADLIVLVFYLPFALTDTFPFGETICKLSETLADLSTGVSAFSIIALSGYSFFSRETVSSQAEWSRKNVLIVVASIWVLAFAFAAPTLVFAHLSNFGETSYRYCDAFDPRFEPVEGPMRFITYYAVPLSSVSILYCMAKQNANANIGSDISKLAIWLVVVYAISFLGENLFMFWVYLPMAHVEDWSLFEFISYLIGILYRCINPIVLYCVSDTFQSLFKEHLIYWFSSETREPVVDLSRNREAGTGAEISQPLV